MSDPENHIETEEDADELFECVQCGITLEPNIDFDGEICVDCNDENEADEEDEDEDEDEEFELDDEDEDE